MVNNPSFRFEHDAHLEKCRPSLMRMLSTERKLVLVAVLGGRFLKVPKLYGPFSGAAISFVSQERREFNSSNLIVNFFLLP